MAYLRILLFLIPLLLIFVLAHVLLYLAVVRFFHVTNTHYKIGLVAMFAFFGVSFFTSSILARASESLFTRSLYFLSATWLGLLLNFLLASLLSFIVLRLSGYLGASWDSKVVAGIMFIGAFFYSLYGVQNALHPRLREITVHVPNLPEEWKGKKIVQMSDVHLGLLHREAFMRDIVTMTNQVNPDMIVITGDLFDGMDGDVEPLVRPLLDLHPQWGTYFITGNHETYFGVDEALSALRKTNVNVLKNEVVDVHGVSLIGINYPAMSENEDVVQVLDRLKPEFGGRPNILLYHAPTHIKEIGARGVNLMLSGHTHKGQLFPFGFITRLVYQEYDYGLYTEGDFSLYTSDGAGTWGPLMRTGNTPEIVSITVQ